MLRKTLFIVVFFYFLVLFQTGFLSAFNFSNPALNMIIISVIIINLFGRDPRTGIVSALIGGFYMDIFHFGSDLFFGFFILVFLISALLIKFILNKNVRFPVAKRI